MKILIVKTSALGDIVHTFGVINFLKKAVASVCIDWVVEEAGEDLVKRHPHINKTISIRTRKWRKNLLSSETLSDYMEFKRSLQETNYDVVFDLQGNCKSGWITHLARSKAKVGFGFKTAPEWPNTLFTNIRFNPPKNQNVRANLLYIVQKYFKIDLNPSMSPALLALQCHEKMQLEAIKDEYFLSDAMQVLICCGSNWENKQLSTDIWADFLKKLQQRNAFQQKLHYLFIWGNEKERERVDSLASLFPTSRVLPKISLPLLQHVMAHMGLVITMDSLPLHLAALTGCPTWSVFGPSLAYTYAPFEAHHISFQGKCPYGISFEKRCPKLRTCSTGACMKTIDPEQLLEKFIPLGK